MNRDAGHQPGFKMKNILDINQQVKNANAWKMNGEESSDVSSFKGVPLFNRGSRYNSAAAPPVSPTVLSQPDTSFMSANMVQCPNRIVASSQYTADTLNVDEDLRLKLNESYSVIGQWQREAFSVFSSLNSSATNVSSVGDLTSQVNESMYRVAAAAKLRQVSYIRQRANSTLLLQPGGGQMGFPAVSNSNRATATNAHPFKMPGAVPMFRKPVEKIVRTVKCWHFVENADGFLLSGRCKNYQGKLMTWTSRPLADYKRTGFHTLETLDCTRLIVLERFKPVGSRVFLHHPDYIVTAFHQGLPTNWKDILVAWRRFIRQGKHEQFVWPLLQTPASDHESHFYDSVDDVSLFTSASAAKQPVTQQTEVPVQVETERQCADQVLEKSPETICTLKNKINLPTDRSFCMNKFISSTSTEKNKTRAFSIVLNKIELPLNDKTIEIRDIPTNTSAPETCKSNVVESRVSIHQPPVASQSSAVNMLVNQVAVRAVDHLAEPCAPSSSRTIPDAGRKDFPSYSENTSKQVVLVDEEPCESRSNISKRKKALQFSSPDEMPLSRYESQLTDLAEPLSTSPMSPAKILTGKSKPAAREVSTTTFYNVSKTLSSKLSKMSPAKLTNQKPTVAAVQGVACQTRTHLLRAVDKSKPHVAEVPQKSPTTSCVKKSRLVKNSDDIETRNLREESLRSHNNCVKYLDEWILCVNQEENGDWKLHLKGVLYDYKRTKLEEEHTSKHVVNYSRDNKVVMTSDSYRYRLLGTMQKNRKQRMPKYLHRLVANNTSTLLMDRWPMIQAQLSETLSSEPANKKRKTTINADGVKQQKQEAEGDRKAKKKDAPNARNRETVENSRKRKRNRAQAVTASQENLETDNDLECSVGSQSLPQRHIADTGACKFSSRGRRLIPVVNFWAPETTSQSRARTKKEDSLNHQRAKENPVVPSSVGAKPRAKDSKEYNSRDAKSTMKRNTRQRPKHNKNTKEVAKEDNICESSVNSNCNVLKNATNRNAVYGKTKHPPMDSKMVEPINLQKQSIRHKRKSSGSESNGTELKPKRSAKKTLKNTKEKLTVIAKPVGADLDIKPGVARKKMLSKKEIFERQKALLTTRKTEALADLFDAPEYELDESLVLPDMSEMDGDPEHIRTPKRIGTPLAMYNLDFHDSSSRHPRTPEVQQTITDKERREIISYGIQRQLDLKNCKFTKTKTELKTNKKSKDLKTRNVNSQIEDIFNVLTKNKIPMSNVLPVLQNKRPFDPMEDDVFSETDSRLELLFERSESDSSE